MRSFNASEILKVHGYRVTKGRARILETIANTRKPLTVDEVHEILGIKSIDRVTLYRALEAFVASHIVRRVDLPHSHSHRYELEDARDHHHIVCTDCGRIEDFIDEAHGRVEKKVLAKSKAFQKITGHSFDLYGLCKTCAK